MPLRPIFSLHTSLTALAPLPPSLSLLSSPRCPLASAPPARLDQPERRRNPAFSSAHRVLSPAFLSSCFGAARSNTHRIACRAIGRPLQPGARSGITSLLDEEDVLAARERKLEHWACSTGQWSQHGQQRGTGDRFSRAAKQRTVSAAQLVEARRRHRLVVDHRPVGAVEVDQEGPAGAYTVTASSSKTEREERRALCERLGVAKLVALSDLAELEHGVLL